MSSQEVKIKYKCVQCGNCCRWRGYVHVTNEEIEAIARFLGMPYDTFMAKYTRLTADRKGLSLTEKDNGECVFLEGNKCLIHDVKPRQCKRFPNEWNFEGFREVCNAEPIV